MSRGIPISLWAGKTDRNTPLVAIHWADIRSVDRWNDDDEEIRPARKIRHGGYLLYEGVDPVEPTEEIVVLAQVYDAEENTWHGFTVIPKRAFRGVASSEATAS